MGIFDKLFGRKKQFEEKIGSTDLSSYGLRRYDVPDELIEPFKKLLSHLESPESLKRRDAVNGLVEFLNFAAINQDEAGKLLCRALKDEHFGVRSDAARVISQFMLESAEVLRALGDALEKDEDKDVRLKCVEALTSSALSVLSWGRVEQLLRGQEEKDKDVGIKLIEALERAKETETPPGKDGIVDDVLSELQARFEKDVFKKWEERWVEPAQFDLVVSEVPAKFQDEFLQKLTVLLPATKSKIAEEFQFCIDEEGIPNEEERWIKGSSEAVMLYMGSKVAKATQKSGFERWEIKEDPRYYHPLEDPLCPLLGVAVFFTEPKKSFSYSIIAKTEDGEICAIDGFFPTDIS